MSETPAAETPPAEGAPAAPAAPASPAAPPAAPASGKAPNWDGDFDPARAARLVENLRAENAALKAATAKANTDTGQSADDRIAALEARAAKAERNLLVAEAVKAHGIPDDLVEFLTADTAEALTKQAEALAKHAKKPADEVPGRPKPRLTPGTGSGSEAPAFDAKALAESLRRR